MKQRKKKGQKEVNIRQDDVGFHDEIINKLEQAFMVGANDPEACLWAGIDWSELKEYFKKNPKFKTRSEQLRNRRSLRCKFSLYAGVDDDPKLALDVLERLEAEEYGKKNNLKISGDPAKPIEIEVHRKQIKELTKDELYAELAKL
jgi:hypothetical protein